MKQRAFVYAYGSWLIIAAMSQSDAGIWVGLDPLVTLAVGLPSASLGSAVLDEINRSDKGRPHPTAVQMKEGVARLLAAAGVRSLKTFNLGASLVTIERDGPEYVVTRRFRVTKGGKVWFGGSGSRVQLTAPSDDELGLAVADAMALDG